MRDQCTFDAMRLRGGAAARWQFVSLGRCIAADERMCYDLNCAHVHWDVVGCGVDGTACVLWLLLSTRNCTAVFECAALAYNPSLRTATLARNTSMCRRKTPYLRRESLSEATHCQSSRPTLACLPRQGLASASCTPCHLAACPVPRAQALGQSRSRSRRIHRSARGFRCYLTCTRHATSLVIQTALASGKSCESEVNGSYATAAMTCTCAERHAVTLACRQKR